MRALLATAALAATTLLACANGQTTTAGSGGSGGTGGGGTGGDGASTTTGTTTTTMTGDTGGSGGAGATGGMGGMGATGGGGTTTTTTTSSMGGGGGADPCGNGVKDPGEQCDDQDFGGKTCASIGFSGGFLQCNSFCAIVASGCTPPENCSNGQDDDQDGLPDCLDTDCNQQPVCLDSCAAPTPVILPSFNFSDTTGRPAVQTSSCSAAAGSEIIYQLVAPATVDMTVVVYPFNLTDFTVSVRTSCADLGSEIHCENKIGSGDFSPEQFLVSLVQGQTYYVIIDGTQVNDFGGFQIEMSIPQPEFDCGNHFDDDFDGYLDCDDPNNCQGDFYCIPGIETPGAQCFSNSDCAATDGDPICLGSQEGFADGYCSEFCDLLAPACTGDGICVDPAVVIGKTISVNGICLDACNALGDCRPGYDCVDRGLSSKVCIVAPENICDDFKDNDLDGTIDCQDLDCQAGAVCSGGAKVAGQPCTSTGECFSNLNDPVCLTQNDFGYPGGYCSQFCDPGINDCGGGAICTQGWVPIDSAVCLDVCVNANECLPGYSCLDIGYPKKVCVF
jgi:hypothetical protein